MWKIFGENCHTTYGFETMSLLTIWSKIIAKVQKESGICQLAKGFKKDCQLAKEFKIDCQLAVYLIVGGGLHWY